MKGATNNTETNRWDQLYDALSSQPRRTLILSLLEEPEDRWLPLPAAIDSYIHPMESEDSELRLRHHHLPKLAELGYITWESDPFRVRRGHNFEVPAFVVSKMVESSHEYPDALRNECVVVGGVDE